MTGLSGAAIHAVIAEATEIGSLPPCHQGWCNNRAVVTPCLLVYRSAFPIRRCIGARLKRPPSSKAVVRRSHHYDGFVPLFARNRTGGSNPTIISNRHHKGVLRMEAVILTNENE